MSRWISAAAAVLASLTALAGLLLASAMPVVLDVRPAFLLLSLCTVVALAWLSRRTGSGVTRLTAATLATMFAVAAVLAAYDLFLAYRTREVTFRSGDVELHGTLYLPGSSGPHPGVVLVHGSGRQPRDEYRFYARLYARAGIAALAWDKRGSGLSGGSESEATYEQLARDAAAAVLTLRQEPEIDAARVGLWGLSEGEWVASLAAEIVSPAFLVLVSPSAMTPSEQVGYESSALVKRAGFGEASAREAAELYSALADYQRTGLGRDVLNRRLAAASAKPWFEAARYLEPSVPEYDRVLALSWFPAWRDRMDFDPRPSLSRLRCPLLAQVGGSDPKNDGAAVVERIRAALSEDQATRFTGKVYPDGGHGVIEWRLPGGLPPPWFSAGYLQDQVDWVVRQTMAQ